MLCEGEKMLGEALRSGAKLKTVLVRDGWDSPLVKEAEEQGASLYSAPDALFKLASEVETPQNVIFSCEQPQWTADALDGAGQVLLLDGNTMVGGTINEYNARLGGVKITSDRNVR